MTHPSKRAMERATNLYGLCYCNDYSIDNPKRPCYTCKIAIALDAERQKALEEAAKVAGAATARNCLPDCNCTCNTDISAAIRKLKERP